VVFDRVITYAVEPTVAVNSPFGLHVAVNTVGGIPPTGFPSSFCWTATDQLARSVKPRVFFRLLAKLFEFI